MNVLDVKYSRSLVGASQLDRGRDEEVSRSAGIEEELARRVDQRVMRWLDMWKAWVSSVWLDVC